MKFVSLYEQWNTVSNMGWASTIFQALYLSILHVLSHLILITLLRQIILLALLYSSGKQGIERVKKIAPIISVGARILTLLIILGAMVCCLFN